MVTTHTTPAALCPYCKAEHDRASNIVGEGAPAPGDLTVCSKCGNPLKYGPALELCPLTVADCDALTPEEGGAVAQAMEAVRALLARQ